MSQSRRGIVVIPGYKGSHLYSETLRKKVWFTTGNIFPSNKNLKMHTSIPQDDPLKIRSTEVINSLKILPGYTVDIFDNFLSNIDMEKYKIFPFAYDWRKDLYEVISDFSKFIDDLKKEGFDDLVFYHTVWVVLLSVII